MLKQRYYHGATANPKNINLVENAAFEKPNTWIAIPPGRAKRQTIVQESLQIIHVPNVFLQGNENSCAITSLANALMYINDKASAYELMKHKKKCLATTRRLQFLTTVLRAMGYTVTKITDFDVLNNVSNWPTVCGLSGSDGDRGHAVSVCGQVLFDGSVSHAMKLTKENLNWCCGAPGITVNYVKVYLAYRFEMFGYIPKHFKQVL